MHVERADDLGLAGCASCRAAARLIARPPEVDEQNMAALHTDGKAA
jgi:hypothetical protein